jgi:hypothetical protein
VKRWYFPILQILKTRQLGSYPPAFAFHIQVVLGKLFTISASVSSSLGGDK